MTVRINRILASLSATVFVLMLPSAGPAQSTAGETKPSPLQELDWLAGHWVSPDGRQEEVWLPPAGEVNPGRDSAVPGVFLGIHRDSRDASRVFYEYLRIELRDGVPCYIAQPMGGKGAEFCLAEQQEHSAVFSNLRHDFPQHIRYQLRDDTLHASVWGEVAGRRKTARWRFIRKAGH